jgi:hypothetical protein
MWPLPRQAMYAVDLLVMRNTDQPTLSSSVLWTEELNSHTDKFTNSDKCSPVSCSACFLSYKKHCIPQASFALLQKDGAKTLLNKERRHAACTSMRVSDVASWITRVMSYIKVSETGKSPRMNTNHCSYGTYLLLFLYNIILGCMNLHINVPWESSHFW